MYNYCDILSKMKQKYVPNLMEKVTKSVKAVLVFFLIKCGSSRETDVRFGTFSPSEKLKNDSPGRSGAMSDTSITIF